MIPSGRRMLSANRVGKKRKSFEGRCADVCFTATMLPAVGVQSRFPKLPCNYVHYRLVKGKQNGVRGKKLGENVGQLLIVNHCRRTVRLQSAMPLYQLYRIARFAPPLFQHPALFPAKNGETLNSQKAQLPFLLKIKKESQTTLAIGI